MASRSRAALSISVVLGVALTPFTVSAQAPVPVQSAGQADQAQTRPSRVHNALRSAMDCYRRGDYELAATYFQQAQAGQDDLTADERQALTNWLQLNGTALQARREGANQLRQAEQAMKQGRTQDAQGFLKAVTPNQQFLTAADKQRFQQLSERALPGNNPTTQPPGTSNATALAQARTKLKQARVLMGRGMYDAAQALAHEAEQLNAPYLPGEDNPKKLLGDISHARLATAKPADPKSMLAAARTALNRGDLDEADRLAAEADKAGSVWNSMTHIWSDSPSKVHRDVQAERAKQLARKNTMKVTDQQVVKSTEVRKPAALATETVTVSAGNRTETARQLLKEARTSLKAGNVAQAKQLTEKAKALKPELNWWEDTPDKLFAEIHQIEGAKQASDSKGGAAADRVASDPHAMLKQARELYNAGKLDEAEKLTLSANTAKGAHWGLFDFDSPDRLLGDIRKARFKRDQEESVRVLAEGRKLYEKGNYQEAERLAHRAEVLHHGPYSLLEFGDQPRKLLAEIDTAKAKQKNQMPPAPTAVAKKDMEIPVTAKQPAPAPTWPSVAEKNAVNSTPPATNVVQTAMPAVPVPGPTFVDSKTVPAAPAATSNPWNDKKAQARSYLDEARRLQKEGRLIEARQMALEAQQMALEAQRQGASFGLNEDRPELCLLALAAVCQKRIESLVQEASDYSAGAQGDAGRYQRAETSLNQAKQLAVAYGFDTHSIDSSMSFLQRMRTMNWATTPSTMPAKVAQAQHEETTAATAPEQRGRSLLNQARLELRAGQTTTARRLAETAFEPQYGVQAEAAQILRSIDAEEFNQKVLTANRSFDAGMGTFSRREYAQAGTIFRSLDSHLLTPEKQSRLKELMLTPEMQPTAVAQATHRVPAAGGGMEPGRTQVSDFAPTQSVSPEADFAQQVKAMQEVKFQKLRNDGLEVQSEATKRFQSGETDRALEILQEYEAGLKDSGLDAEKIAMLRRPIDARLSSFKILKHQRDFEKLQIAQQENGSSAVTKRMLREEDKKKQMADLMKQYNSFFREGKYQEAEKYAMLAHELDPDDPVPSAAIYTARMQANQVKYSNIKKEKETYFNNQMDDSEKVGPAVNIDNPVAFDQKSWQDNRGRKMLAPLNIGEAKSDKEKAIYRRLDEPISSIDFKDTPLRQILDDLQGWTGINIVADEPALNEQGINLDRPVTMKLEGVVLKSALNLLLHQVHLTHVVKDEALVVTTEEHARGKLKTQMHPVIDLITPVNNSPGLEAMDPIRAATQQATGGGGSKLNNVAPWLGSSSLTGGKDVGQYANGGANSPGMGTPTQMVQKDNTKGTIEDVLIKLITNTIAPQSWDSVGGPGHIDYWPLGSALVVNQTPDIQEQVAELLQALRRLLDQEVAVEIRFITIAESFYEKIGVDFNINIRTNNTRYEPQLVSQQFRPFGFINHFTPSNLISGITPGGTLTQDLNIPIKSSSFEMAAPPFGGFPNIPGGNGGLELGLAFLSDIEVFLFMEAAQADRRTNVMQAPKLTMFNGQTSTLTITDQQFFVVAVNVLQAGGQVVFSPVNLPIPTGGVALTMSSVISADRRFVRMNLTPTLTNLTTVPAPLFPITTFITPIFEGGAVGQPIPFTQFLQQPSFNTIAVLTTVNVPDGGTVMVGGLKRLSEGRDEFGPPILSKIPYINRLFKNTAYGRETESLLMMVTPRIIINEEEEQKQVPNAAPGAGG